MQVIYQPAIPATARVNKKSETGQKASFMKEAGNNTALKAKPLQPTRYRAQNISRSYQRDAQMPHVSAGFATKLRAFRVTTDIFQPMVQPSAWKAACCLLIGPLLSLATLPSNIRRLSVFYKHIQNHIWVAC